MRRAFSLSNIFRSFFTRLIYDVLDWFRFELAGVSVKNGMILSF